MTSPAALGSGSAVAEAMGTVRSGAGIAADPPRQRPAWNQELAASLETGDATPRYLRLAALIRDLIRREAFRAGEALPSERDLSQLTGLARVTVRRAIEELLREGILTRRHGSGTYVTRRIEQPLSVLAGFSEDMASRGHQAGSTWLAKGVGRPTPAEALALGVAPSGAVVRLARVRTADGEPLAIETAVVPTGFLPSADLVDQSLYAALAARGVRPATGVQRLHAALATGEEARHLRIPEGAAVLRIERRAFLADGRPVEFTTSTYRGDRYDFVATLHGV